MDSNPAPASLAAPDAPRTRTEAELRSQPDIWQRVIDEPDERLAPLPAADDRVAVIGCGTSYYVGDAYSRSREARGRGLTRALVASEMDRPYEGETLLLISRSGTTGDLLRVAERYAGTRKITGIIGAPGTPLVAACDETVLLDYADELSTIQTRFATSVLTLLRRSIGEDVSLLPGQARQALRAPVPLRDENHFVFLGTGPAASLASEAALKCREAGGVWAEAYAMNEYLHGPVSAATARTLVWPFNPPGPELSETVQKAGARMHEPQWDPQAELVLCHRLAVALAQRAGRDPDNPRYLSRSVI